MEVLARARSAPHRQVQRAKALLLAADGVANNRIADEVGVTVVTVRAWRNRFAEEGLAKLGEVRKGRGPKPSIPAEKVEEIVAATLHSKPKGETHWSTRSMAKHAGVSRNTVQRIWKARGLKPHLVDTFKISTDPAFEDKLTDVVGVYLNPPEQAVVLCLDEKSQVQALDRTQPLLPLSPGQAERGTHDYVRNGTTSLFAALNVATGGVIGKCYRRHRQQEFLKFLEEIDARIAKEPGVTIHIILDNYGTHKTPKVKRWFQRHPEYRLHFTPTSGSWLNQVERFFAEITEKRIRRGAFRSVAALEAAIMEYLAHHNENPRPFVWTANADLILERVKKVCERIGNSGD